MPKTLDAREYGSIDDLLPHIEVEGDKLANVNEPGTAIGDGEMATVEITSAYDSGDIFVTVNRWQVYREGDHPSMASWHKAFYEAAVKVREKMRDGEQVICNVATYYGQVALDAGRIAIDWQDDPEYVRLDVENLMSLEGA